MEKLTQQQRDLILCLKVLGVEEGAVVGIMLALRQPHQMASLADYLLHNKQATQSDILGAVTKIVLAEKNKTQA